MSATRRLTALASAVSQPSSTLEDLDRLAAVGALQPASIDPAHPEAATCPCRSVATCAEWAPQILRVTLSPLERRREVPHFDRRISRSGNISA